MGLRKRGLFFHDVGQLKFRFAIGVHPQNIHISESALLLQGKQRSYAIGLGNGMIGSAPPQSGTSWGKIEMYEPVGGFWVE